MGSVSMSRGRRHFNSRKRWELGLGIGLFVVLSYPFPIHAQNYRADMDSAQSYLNKNSCAEALPFASRAAEKALAAHGDRDTATASAWRLLASVLNCLGTLPPADSLYRRALAIRETVFGTDHFETWLLRSEMASNFSVRERMKELDRFLSPPLRPYLDGKPADHHVIVACLTLLAGAKYGLGRLDEAEQVMRLGLKGLDSLGYTNDYGIFTTIATGGWLFIDLGKAQEAEQLLSSWITRLEASGAVPAYVARLYSNLGEALHALGRVLDAEKAYLRARAMFLAAVGPEFEDPTVLANLGVLYLGMHRYVESETFLRASIALMLPNTSEIGRQYGNLSAALQAQGRFREAEEACREALAIQRRSFGDRDHYLISRTLFRLGTFLYRQGRYPEADSILGAARTMGQKTLPPGDDRLGRYSLWWAQTSREVGRMARADSLMHLALDLQLAHLHANWATLTEKEKNQFIGTFRTTLEGALAHACRRTPPSPDMTGALYDAVLAGKALIQYSTRMVQSHIQRSGDTMLLRRFQEWTALKNRLAWMDRRGRRGTREMDSLAQLANGLEKSLTLESRAFASALAPRAITWQQVRSRLDPHAGAVEILRFRDVDNAWREHTRYAALVLRGDREGAPVLVPLAPGDSLENGWYTDYTRLQTPPRSGEDGEYARLRSLSWQRYWAPLHDAVQGLRRVTIAPDGVYHLVSLDILAPEGGRFVGEDLEVRRTTSTRTLLDSASTREPRRTALLIGAPDFGGRGPISENASRSAWSPLRHSAEEVQDIAALLRKRRWEVRVLTGAEATETAVASSSPGLLHVSTHGYFREDTSRVEDPVLRELVSSAQYHEAYLQSGVVFAGANEDREDPANDGTLTALEASSLNLTETALVVLSACETGRGSVRTGEGVYGLQRGFLLAGARAVLMSLWKVEDGITRELMASFYAAWLRTHDASASLREAIRVLRRARPWLSPADWGGFVVVE